VNSEPAPENGTATATSVGVRTSADASGRTRSESADAKRKREARAAKRNPDTSSIGGRGGSAAKGNSIPPSGGVSAHMGEALSPGEAESQLFWGHVGLAKAIRADIDMEELRPEFHVAGENYAYVANHIWTPLRVVIRFIAPIVLVAVLLVIWGRIFAATPWVNNVRDWWQRRRGPDESAPPPPARHASPPAEEQSAVGAERAPSEPVQPPPAIPRRPTLVRTMGHRL
jgi:hypothetical protein